MDRVLTADDLHAVAQLASRNRAFIVAAWCFECAAKLTATPEAEHVLRDKAFDAMCQALRYGQAS